MIIIISALFEVNKSYINITYSLSNVLKFKPLEWLKCVQPIRVLPCFMYDLCQTHSRESTSHIGV